MFHASTRKRVGMLSIATAATLALAACGGSDSGGTTGSSGGGGDKPIVGLITKTDTNPFFVKMKEGAQKAADAQGVDAADLRRQVRTATTRPRCRRSRT